MKNFSAATLQIVLIAMTSTVNVESFVAINPPRLSTSTRTTTQRFVATDPSTSANNNNNNNDDDDDDDNSISSAVVMDDDTLLESVPHAQFQALCTDFNLSIDGTKEELLLRLRTHAQQQAALDKQRKLDRAQKVQQGVGDVSKERYEITSDDIDAEDDNSLEDEGFFYFSMPGTIPGNQTTTSNTTTTTTANDKAMTKSSNDKMSKDSTNKTKKTKKTARQVITAPPPPEQANEQGERVVTVYSTTETNDLTGAAAAQNGGNTDKSVLLEGNDGSSGSNNQDGGGPWELGGDKVKVPVELQKAKDTVTDLVQSLLLLSGAPGFREDFSEGLQPNDSSDSSMKMMPTSDKFVGFDPSQVPGDVLIASSKCLRAGRGSVLQDVLNELELRAVGHDGMAGDNMDKGGGHYNQVSRVRAFLEGFRRAEVRRVARETTTLLLDKVASEGIQGLDTMLATMTKAQDDSGDAGELSDSLLDFLNDMVREQEKRVGDDINRMGVVTTEEQPTAVQLEPATLEESKDKLESLWDVSNNEDGERIETLDPKDPKVKAALEEECIKNDAAAAAQQQQQQQLPTRAPEQMLLLLKLLRDRIKAEAAFGGGNGGSEEDVERGRNLRILAYCLRFERPMDREKLLRREFQSSVDRMDSFLELVASSMEYAESTSTQLQPSSGLLDRKLLGSIYDLSRKIRDQTAASGR